MKRYLAGIAVLVALFALSGCSVPKSDSTKLQVVASTNVWADIAAQIGGDLVDVKSLISNSNQDPHSYSASVRDQLAVSKADLLIANGSGYDDFMDVLAAAASNKTVLHASDVTTSIDVSVNEHVWFSVDAVEEVANQVTKRFEALDPKNADAYVANAEVFNSQLAELKSKIANLRTVTNGYTYFATEPLAYWLLADLGFSDSTPFEFSNAIENETDVPPVTFQKSLDLISKNAVIYLVVNKQTENSQVAQIVEAANVAGVREVVLQEILPEGIGYLQWMQNTLKTLNPGT